MNYNHVEVIYSVKLFLNLIFFNISVCQLLNSVITLLLVNMKLVTNNMKNVSR